MAMYYKVFEMNDDIFYEVPENNDRTWVETALKCARSFWWERKSNDTDWPYTFTFHEDKGPEIARVTVDMEIDPIFYVHDE